MTTIEDGRKAKYRVMIETADGYLGAGGMDNLVTLQMTGGDGTVTEELYLEQFGTPKFGRGERDVFHLEALDVGLPVMIRLELRNHEKKNPWAVRRVKIRYNDQKVLFPVHDWIETEMSCTTGTGRPYHKVQNAHVRSMLKREVEYSKVVLPWVRRPGPNDPTTSLPRYVDAMDHNEIPLILRPTEVWTQSFMTNAPQEAIKKALIDVQRNDVDDLK